MTVTYEQLASHRWARTGLTMSDGSLWCPCLDCYDAARCIKDGERMGVTHIIQNGFAPKFDSGVELDLVNDVDGISKIVCMEIKRDYYLDDLGLVAGDVVIDIGAHKGIVSCYLAKRYPDINVYAYEPLIDNVEALKENARRNGVNIEVNNLAVTGDGRDVMIHYSNDNTGGANIFSGGDKPVKHVKSAKFEDVLGRFEKIALLKIDCEGAEYELDPKLLSNVMNLRGEFHNTYGDAEALLAKVRQYVKNSLVSKQN